MRAGSETRGGNERGGRLARLLCAFATGLLAVPVGGVARADVAQVTMIPPGGAQQTLSLDVLAGSEDVVEQDYALASAGGERTQAVTGFSLAALLEAAGADPYGFSYLEVQRPAGGAVLLSRHQALDPGAFADGPPVVYATAAGTGFLRPRAGGDDRNASDSFGTPQGVTIVLRKGSPLQVRASASTPRTRPGREVAFSAIVERAGSGEQLTYSWYFDDGHSASGASVSHRFAKRGSYDVVVGVTTPGDSAGASAVVTVQVGPPLSGPDRKGGGRNSDAGAPDHGAATGSGPARTPRLRSHLCPHGGGKCERGDAAKRRQPGRESPGGRQVSGVLLSSAPQSPAEPAVTAGARTGTLDGEGSSAGLSDTALGVLATLGLLGLGALTEARGAFLSLSERKAPGGGPR